MKRILLILGFSFSATILFAQTQCTFQSESKHEERKDQYSKSSEQNIKSSQNAMDKQGNQFQKPKYAAETKPTPETRRKRRSQY